MSKQKADKLVSKNAVRVVEISSLKVDPSYQRPVIKGAVLKINKGFDPVAFGLPVVAERENGDLFIVDGQQRIEYLKTKTDKKTVRCEVFASRGPEHEAHVFKLVNRNRTPLKPIQLFHAMLTAGDETCWTIKEVVEKNGFRIPKGQPHGHKDSPELRSVQVCAIGAISRVWAQSGGRDSIEFVFNILKDVWPNDALRTNGDIIMGLGLMFSRHKKVVDRDRLIPRLMATTPSKILYSAQLGIGNRAGQVADMIEKLYRKQKVK